MIWPTKNQEDASENRVGSLWPLMLIRMVEANCVGVRGMVISKKKKSLIIGLYPCEAA